MSSEYSIINNMYFQGTVKHSNSNNLRVKDCIIEIERQEVNKEFFDLQYRYRCTLKFKDLLGRVIREVSFSEMQAQILIDNINTFVYDNYANMYVLTGITGSSSVETYSIFLKESENKDNDFCVILQLLCNNAVLQQTFPIFTVTLDLQELDDLLNVMFFVYLIDLVSERQGIYQV